MANDGGNGDGDITTAAVRSPSRHRRKIKEARVSRDSSVDLISTLPDVILQHILCFIPTRFAIRTSLLSKRWKHVWSDTPSLYFYFWHTMKEPNADLVNKTLTRYTAHKMMNFNLCTTMVEYMPYVDGWIEFVMSRNVEIISLNLLFNVGNYNIPDFFYINSSVKQLNVALYRYELKIPSCLVSWTSLKKLTLSYCHSGYIDKILSGCPILECLMLDHCDERLMKVLDLSKSLCLRTLQIHNYSWEVPAEPVQIVAPHIHYLRLTHSQPLCTLVDVSSLTEARLNTCFPSSEEETEQSRVLKMLEKLHNVEKLTFGANFLKILSLAELRGVPFPSLKIKELRLETMVNQDIIHGLVRLLHNSPELKKLTVHGTIPVEYKLLGFGRLEIRSVNKGL